jgi:hypothetical protein
MVIQVITTITGNMGSIIQVNITHLKIPPSPFIKGGGFASNFAKEKHVDTGS